MAIKCVKKYVFFLKSNKIFFCFLKKKKMTKESILKYCSVENLKREIKI